MAPARPNGSASMPSAAPSVESAPVVGRLRRRFRRFGALAACATVGLTLLVGPGAGTASAEPSANDWYRLRVCESGNNYAINTGNGYYGAYQFDLSTWRSVGGSGRPDQASPAVQDALALKLWYSRGWSPWSCARIVGLTGSPPAGGQPAAAAAPAVLAKPIGTIDSMTVDTAASTVTVTGWTFDPNATGSGLAVHMYVNGVGYALGSGGIRSDVNSAFRISGNHGIGNTVPARRGANEVCVFAIGVTAGNNTLLACRTVQVPYAPIGTVDSAQFSGGASATVTGWTLDPNQPDRSIPAHLYVNGAGAAAVQADGGRGDVNARLGVPGNHGYSVQVPAQPGANTVCAFGIGSSLNTLLRCTSFQAPGAPLGAVDRVSVSGGQATVTGWAVDPANPDASTRVDVYVQGAGASARADIGREDVDRFLGVGGAHGYAVTVPAAPGAQICAFAIGESSGFNTLLSCTTA